MTTALLDLETMARTLEDEARESERLERLSQSLDSVISDIRQLRQRKAKRLLNSKDCREDWQRKIAKFERTARSLTLLRTRRQARKLRAALSPQSTSLPCFH